MATFQLRQISINTLTNCRQAGAFLTQCALWWSRIYTYPFSVSIYVHQRTCWGCNCFFFLVFGRRLCSTLPQCQQTQRSPQTAPRTQSLEVVVFLSALLFTVLDFVHFLSWFRVVFLTTHSFLPLSSSSSHCQKSQSSVNPSRFSRDDERREKPLHLQHSERERERDRRGLVG